MCHQWSWKRGTLRASSPRMQQKAPVSVRQLWPSLANQGSSLWPSLIRLRTKMLVRRKKFDRKCILITIISRAVVDAIDGGGYKGSLQVFDIANQSMKSLGHFSLPTVSVPFDFDGDRLVWLEFQQKGKKDFGMYHVKSLETTSLFTFDKSVDFVSHVKLAG